MNEKVLFFAVFFALVVGCGGNVVVDHNSPAGGGGAGASPGSGGTTLATIPTGGGGTGIGGNPIPTTAVVSSSATTMSTSTTTPGCNSCNEVESGADPSAICPASSPAYQDLLSCSCTGSGPCLVSCGNNFCARTAASGPCAACQAMGCSLQLNACQSM